MSTDDPRSGPRFVGDTRAIGYDTSARAFAADASRLQRLAAFLVDALLELNFACLGVFLAIAWIGDFVLIGPGSETTFSCVLGSVMALSVVQWLLIARTGRSIGKWAAGARIVRLEDDGPPGLLRGVLLRQWLPAMLGALGAVGAVLRLVDVLAVFGADRRCIHDRIAKTRVVRVF